ncbi:MAG: hypothetical protein NVS2B8_05530 [Vulcanimicrobiaceae bacterium]
MNDAVAVPPPLIFAPALAIGLALGRTPHDASARNRIARGLGTASIVAGAALGITTFRTLARAHTTTNPYGTPTRLVTDGPFSWSRNPAYVAATSIYVGIAMYQGSLPALVLLPVALALLDHHVVDAEERRLERIFGDDYRAYRARKPRWF